MIIPYKIRARRGLTPGVWLKFSKPRSHKDMTKLIHMVREALYGKPKIKPITPLSLIGAQVHNWTGYGFKWAGSYTGSRPDSLSIPKVLASDFFADADKQSG